MNIAAVESDWYYQEKGNERNKFSPLSDQEMFIKRHKVVMRDGILDCHTF